MAKKVEDQVQEELEVLDEKATERKLAKEEKTMLAKLKAEKHVPIFIPESPLNPNEVVPIGINGVIYAIPVGQQFEVPESIYNVWKYSYDQTRAANQRLAEKLNKEIKIL